MTASIYKIVKFTDYEIEVKFMAKLNGESFDMIYWDKSLYTDTENELIDKVSKSDELRFEFETIVIL